MKDSTKSAEFLAKFHAERNAIQAQVDRLQEARSVSTLDLQPVSAKVTALGASFTMERAMEFLPAYDMKLCNEQMTVLEAGIETLRCRASSRGKFSFKKKPASTTPPPRASSAPSLSPSASTSPPSSTDAEPEDDPIHPLLVPRPVDTEPWSNVSPHGRQFGNIRHSIISASTFFRPEEKAADVTSIKAEVTLVSLRNCIINLLPGSDPSGKEIEVTALYARDLQACVILAGEISGSVRLEKMTVGTLIVGCHQLRMENCESVVVYSAVKTAPAIEKSTLIGFGPYPRMLLYPLPCESKADQVQDFSSVGSGPSPNWKMLGDGSRLADYYIQLFKMKPSEWPNDGKLLPFPEDGDQVQEGQSTGTTPEFEANLRLSDE